MKAKDYVTSNSNSAHLLLQVYPGRSQRAHFNYNNTL